MNSLDTDFSTAARQLTSCAIGHTIKYFHTVDSTMDIAAAVAESATFRSGVVIIAEEQRTGHGRLGRAWVAPAGTALLSTTILTRPHLPEQVTLLPMLAAVATATAIEELCRGSAIQVGIKWPNDILLTAPALQTGKVAGILIDTTFKGHLPDCARLGIGINVNQSERQLPCDSTALPATSLAIALGAPVDRSSLLITLCRKLGALVDLVSAASVAPKKGAQTIYRLWRSRLTMLNQPITIQIPGAHPGSAFSGVAVDADENGNLIVHDIDGKRHSYPAGEVTIRPRVL